MNGQRKPNWNKWRHVPFVKVWHAVALSLDIDPDKVRVKDSWMAETLLFDENQEFIDRDFIARSNLGVALNSTFMGVGLAEFARWALSIGWSVPPELSSLAPPRVAVAESAGGMLEGKARLTALKLILGMALDGYGYNPKAGRSPVPKEISDALQQFGISLTDETIREWLKEAADEVEWHLRD